jgi:hypothetical protein
MLYRMASCASALTFSAAYLKVYKVGNPWNGHFPVYQQFGTLPLTLIFSEPHQFPGGLHVCFRGDDPKVLPLLPASNHF